jgi:hypothetical protein
VLAALQMNPFAKTFLSENFAVRPKRGIDDQYDPVLGRFQNGPFRMQEAVDRITAHNEFQTIALKDERSPASPGGGGCSSRKKDLV